MSTQTFLLPDVGEGLTEAEIVSWRVAPGDAVAVNDVLVEIETAKSLVELPSPFAGVVGDLLAAEGDTVERRRGDHHDRGRRRVRRRPRPRARASTASRTSRRRTAEARCSSATAAPATCSRAGGARRSVRSRASVGVVAKPPIRKLARDLDVDLADVTPSGTAGEVTREDVMKHASQASVFRNIETPEWGAVREETIPVPVPDAAASAPAPSAAPPRGLARGVDPRARRAQGDRQRDDQQRVHRAARLGVGRRRRVAHDGARQAAEDLDRLRRRQGLAAADHGPRRDLGGAPHADGERGVGRHRRRRADPPAPLREPRHRRGDPARPARAEHQGRAGPQHPRTRARAREAHAHGARGQDDARPTSRAARSRSPTSASSASTPAPRSSTRARSGSSRSARSGRSRGWSTARCARAG